MDGTVPAGMVTLLVGDPGLGKSMLTTAYAAQVARQGAVLFLTAEDSISATCRPRLEAVQANLDRIGWVMLRRDGIEEGLVLPDDIAELDRLVGEHEARLVVVDPLTAHLSEMVNSWRDQSVRLALAPLHHLAQRQGCAVLAVLHLNKAGAGTPLHRIGGSIGIPAAARSALLLARDPDDPDGDQGRRRVLAHIKSNVGPLRPSLRYQLEPVLLPADGEPEVQTARLALVGECEHTGEDLLKRPDNEERSERDEASTFLREELRDGPRPTKDVVQAARDAGISQRTLERAKADLGVSSRKAGFGRGWEWHLLSSEDRHDEWRTSGEAHRGGLRKNPHEQKEMALPDVREMAEGRQSQLCVATTPFPGDEGFRDFLNAAYAAGHLTERERHERRLSHNLILRAWPPAREAHEFADAERRVTEALLVDQEEA